MIRRMLALLTVAATAYWLVKRTRTSDTDEVTEEADAAWANEGGANAPDTV